MTPSCLSIFLVLLIIAGSLIAGVLTPAISEAPRDDSSPSTELVVRDELRSLHDLPISESALKVPSISKELYVPVGLTDPSLPLPISSSSSRVPAAGPLLCSDSAKHGKYLLASPDGMLYSVDCGGKVQWSFSTGPSLMASNHPLPNHHSDVYYVDLDENGDLYEYSENFGKRKLNLTIEEYVLKTPEMKGPVVTIGSTTTTVFHVDADSGMLFHIDHLPVIWPSVRVHSTEVKPVLSKLDAGGSAGNANNITIIRTDYYLSSSREGNPLWDMRFAYISAHLSGYGSGIPPSTGDKLELLPPCPGNLPVYRIPHKFNSSNANGMLTSAPDFQNPGVLNMLYEDRRSFDTPQTSCKPTNSCLLDAAEMPPALIFNMLPLASRAQPRIFNTPVAKQLSIDASDNFCKAASGCLPGIDAAAEQGVSRMFPKDNRQVSAWLLIIPFLMLFAAVFYFKLREPVRSHKQVSDLRERQSIVAKKRKARKAVNNKNDTTINEHDGHITSENENAETNEHTPIQRNDTYSFMNLLRADDVGNGRWVGRLFVSNSEIAKGSDGTLVLEGSYDGRPVAVKRLLRAHHDVAFKEIQNLIASDRHPNIVRWYGVEQDLDFVYISLERCTCSLYDLIQLYSESSSDSTFTGRLTSNSTNEYKVRLDSVKGIDKDLELWRSNGLPSSQLLKLMGDVVSGLAHLHELGIIHRDLKPQNVLINSERLLNAKLSDMGISKCLLDDMSSLGYRATGLGSSGWQAPEQLLHGRQTRSVDLFSLGCVLFFCITGGKHPFGSYFERDSNIVNNRIDLFLVDHIPEAINLFFHLLDPNPELRPQAVEVLHHPLFWSSEMRLSFLRDTSDRIEIEDRGNGSELLKALENVGPMAFGGKWGEKLDAAFITDMGRYRKYNFDSTRDLLRVIRNKFNHYRELPKELQEILGSVPEGFDSYFRNRFPKLLIEVYKVVCRYCREEDCFWKYFKSNPA